MELSPLSASPRPSREASRRARHSVDAPVRTSTEGDYINVHTAQPQKHHHHHDSGRDDTLYEPTFSIPSETKVKRDKLARICKILGRDVPTGAVFPGEPPSYEEIEKADRKAAKKAARTPMFPEDYIVDIRNQNAAPPSRPPPTHTFPEDYLPHIRAERDKQAAEKERKAAEKKASGRRPYMPMFPEECVGDHFEQDPPSKRGPTFTFPEDYLPHIQAQREAQLEQSRWYSSPLDTIAELKSSPHPAGAFSSSDSSSDDDDSGRLSYLSTTTSSSYRAHPAALSPPVDYGRGPYAQQPAKSVGRREIAVHLPFRRRGLGSRPEDKVDFEIVHGVKKLHM